MKITNWVNTSTIVLELDEVETLEHRMMSPWGCAVLPVRLTIVWTYRPDPGDWSRAAWTVEASRQTGDLVNLTETDVDEVPAWVTRAMDTYHPGNYEG